MTAHEIITEDQLDLMHFIACDNNISQRQLAQKTGLSIGKVNYCIKALIDIGFVKINNFKTSSKKMNYAYFLTPKGIKEKSVLTNRFIAIKKREYDKLNSYINQ